MTLISVIKSIDTNVAIINANLQKVQTYNSTYNTIIYNMTKQIADVLNGTQATFLLPILPVSPILTVVT